MNDELTYASAGLITKTSKEADGVWRFEVSKATGPELDSDKQILDLDWAKGAMTEWFETGANVREQHDPHRVVGKALVLETRDDGAWIGGKVVDDQAGRKLEHGLFNGLSVGVRDAIIDRSKAALAIAKGGIVKGGRIVEVSLVDRPANPTAKLVMAKADGDGNAEFVEELEEKAESVQHSHSHQHAEGHHRHQHTHGPEVAEHRSLDSDVRHAHDHTDEQCESLVSDDEMKAIVAELEKATLSTEDRKDLPDSDFAIPEKKPGSGSYPIPDAAHARDALARSSGKPEEARVRAAVKKKFPDIEVSDDKTAKPTASDPDPDGNGDNDLTPEGDTDHDYWNEDGTPTAKGRAAGLKESRRKGERRKSDSIDLAVQAAIEKTEAAMLEKVQNLEAELQEVKKMAAPGGPVRSRPAVAKEVAAKADLLRMQRDEYLAYADDLSDNLPLQKSYRDLAQKATDQLEKLAG